MQQPIFVDTVTQIPADFLNLVTAVIFGPLNQATTVTGVRTALGLGTMATQNANAVAITGGTIDAVQIGYNTQATGKFSVLYNYSQPTDPHHAANKSYVDSQIALAGMNPTYLQLNYLALAGGTMLGPLTLSGDPTNPLQPATKRYVDNTAAGYVTQASLNESLSQVASTSYLNSLIAQQAAREMYHDTFTYAGNTNTIPLRVPPAGDVFVFVAGLPVPKSQISVGAQSVTLTFSPVGQVDTMYYGLTGTGLTVSGVLLTAGGTMSGPLFLARDPIQPLEAATKEYVDAKTGSGFNIGAGLTLSNDTISANMLTVAGRTGNVTLTASDVSGLAAVATSGSYTDLSNKPNIPLPYILQPATASALGGIKVGTNLSVLPDGTLSATNQMVPATTTTLGGVIVGSNLTVDQYGNLSATYPALIPATASTLGGIIVGTGLSVAPNGTLSVIPLAPATTSTLGGVIVGSNLTVDQYGTLSAVIPALQAATTSTLGGVIVGAGLSVTSGTVSANVTTVAGRTGDVVLAVADVSGAAPLASPALTGVPTAPTATLGTNTTQIATTAFVQAAVVASMAGVSSFNTRTGAVVLQAADVTGVGGALLASPTFTGTPAAPTATAGTNTTQIATTAFVTAAINGAVVSFNTRTGAVTLQAADVTGVGGALLASPTFTGTPAAPTAAPGTNTTQLATTAFVAASFAPLASPALTGTPTAPTATAGTSTTQIATTAFVATSYAPLASPALTGTPIAPTAAIGTNTTQLATAAFVYAAARSSHVQAITTASGTVTVADQYVGVNFAGACAIALNAGSTFNVGQRITFKDESGAAATNNITLTANGTDKIDGASTAVINQNYGSLKLLWTGSTWSIV